VGYPGTMWHELMIASVVVLAGCSSSETSQTPSPKNVTSWKCCELGNDCHCIEETPNSAVGCSQEVASCGVLDGGVGCCVAALVGGDWECLCAPAGAECPVPGANCLGDCAVSLEQSVSSCPP